MCYVCVQVEVGLVAKRGGTIEKEWLGLETLYFMEALEVCLLPIPIMFSRTEFLLVYLTYIH